MRLQDLRCAQRTLDNGLRLAVVPMPSTHRAVLHAQLAVGSRFEAAADNGLGHFLEHMLYRGTSTHPSAHALSLAIERRGGSLDATTAVDTGTLTLEMPTRQFAELLPIFAEVYRAPKFSGIDIEKGIVREEILEALDDDGEPIDADDLIRGLVFEGHPLGAPIVGTLEHLETFSVRKLRAHHRRFYCASNTVLVAAGPLEPEPTLDLLAQSFSDLASGKVPKPSPLSEQRQRRHHYARHRDSQTQLRVGFRAPSYRDADAPAMEVLLSLLDDGMSTRLYHRICDELGLCYDVSAGYEAYADGGLLELAAETSHEQAAAVLSELLRIVAALRESGPAEDEVAAAVHRFRWEAEAMLDDPIGIAESVAEAIAMGRSVSLEKRATQLEAVSADDVRTVAGRWLCPEHLSVVAVGLLNKMQRRDLERIAADY